MKLAEDYSFNVNWQYEPIVKQNKYYFIIH